MIKLFVGLGNPGKGYELTRHNIGFMVIDSFVGKKRGRFAEQKTEYHLASLRLKGQVLYFAKPMTYMNLSGNAVKRLLAHLELQPPEMLVISDDFAIPFSKLRLRLSGSDGGHNGLRSIVETIGTDDFPRLRMGIGPVPEEIAAENFVLERFPQEELDGLADFITLGVDCLETVIYTGLAEAMNKYNGL
jgi:PTH1 family peptidyl-tRNA hydrolase